MHKIMKCMPTLTDKSKQNNVDFQLKLLSVVVQHSSSCICNFKIITQKKSDSMWTGVVKLDLTQILFNLTIQNVQLLSILIVGNKMKTNKENGEKNKEVPNQLKHKSSDFSNFLNLDLKTFKILKGSY